MTDPLELADVLEHLGAHPSHTCDDPRGAMTEAAAALRKLVAEKNNLSDVLDVQSLQHSADRNAWRKMEAERDAAVAQRDVNCEQLTRMTAKERGQRVRAEEQERIGDELIHDRDATIVKLTAERDAAIEQRDALAPKGD